MQSRLHPFASGLFLSLLLGVLASSAAASLPTTAYGARATFQKGTPLIYADFTLTYAGERLVTTPRFPRGFVFHDFDAVSTGKAVRVSWSSGTGDIGPTPFTIDGKSYTLELSRSDKLGALKKDELVVSRK